MIRRALLTSATLLLIGAVVVFAVTIACDSEDKTLETRRTGVINTENAAVVTGSGKLDDLPVSEVRVGDEIVVTESEWAAIGPVRFYLLTEEQSDEGFHPRQAIKLGEVTPEEDGAVWFRFRLASSYDTPSGQQVRIASGQDWYIWAYQSTDSGSHGTGVGPLTVTPSEETEA